MNFMFFQKYLLIINVITFVVYGLDKLFAIKHKRRIRIITLLGLAFIGGELGGLLAMKIFHHKSRKWYFYVVFAAGIILHIALWWLIGVRFHA